MNKITVGIVGFGFGLGVGYGLTRYKTDQQVNALHDECDELLAHIEQIDKRGMTMDHGVDVEDEETAEVVNIYSGPSAESRTDYSAIKPSIAEIMAERKDAVAIVDEEHAYEEEEIEEDEVPQRILFSDEHPYVITKAQYDAGGNEDQEALTYYAGDDVLVDNAEMPIDNVSFVVGEALDYFGLESEDPDIVYVRNVKTGCDYEVARSRDSFQEVILGIVSAEGPSKRGTNSEAE